MTRAEFDAMLPFYVNGSLDAAMVKRVEAAVHACPRCAEMLRREEAMAARLRRGMGAVLDGR